MWDALAQFYPWRLYLHRCIGQGILPLWNPHQFCGAPFLANLQSAVLYPPNVIFVLMDPARALGFSAALHLLLAAIGVFFLCRSLGVSRAGSALSSLSFGFCTFLISWTELPTVICTLAWLPWIFLTADRLFERPSVGRTSILAILMAICVLGGHLQMAFYCGLASLMWVVRCAIIHKRQIKTGMPAVVVAAALSLLLVCAQALPTAELARLSARAGERTAEAFAGKMITLLQANKLIVAFSPKFFGSPGDGNYVGVWNYAEHTMYIGILGLFLALVGILSSRPQVRGRWFFVALAAISIILATSNTANALPYFGLPGYSGFGSPARILVLWCFSMAMLAGMGLDYMLGVHLGGKKLIMASASAMIFAIAWAACDVIARADLPEEIPGLGVWRIPSAFLILGLFIIALSARGNLSREIGAGLILIIVAADLLTVNWGYNPTCRRDQVSPPTLTTSILLFEGKHERIIPLNDRWNMYSFPDAIFPPNTAMLYGFNDAQGYDSLSPGAYKEWLRDTLDEDPSPPENGNMVFVKRPSPKILNLGRFIVSTRRLNVPNLRRIASKPYIYENPSVSRVSISKGRVKFIPRIPNAMAISAHCPAPAILRINDAYFPGWRLYIGRHRTSFSDVGPTYMCCLVPAGDHNVNLSYEPSSFRVGMHLSLIGLAVIGGMFGFYIASRRMR